MFQRVSKSLFSHWEFLNEKGTQPKTDTSAPMADLRCRSGRKVRAYQWATAHRTTSRAPINCGRLKH
jgi:hypothetical protein